MPSRLSSALPPKLCRQHVTEVPILPDIGDRTLLDRNDLIYWREYLADNNWIPEASDLLGEFSERLQRWGRHVGYIAKY